MLAMGRIIQGAERAYSLSLYAGRGQGRGCISWYFETKKNPLPNPLPEYQEREVAFLSKARQPRMNEWPPVVRDVANELRKLAAR